MARVSSERAASEQRDYGRSAGLLTVALGISGVLTYAFFAIASHSLSASAYGDIVILWSVVFLLASTMFRPVEQLLASTLAEQEQAGASSTAALRSAAVIQSGLFCLVALVLLVARGPIEDELFAGQDALYWILIASLLGFGLAYYARGFLAGPRPVPPLRGAARDRGQHPARVRDRRRRRDRLRRRLRRPRHRDGAGRLHHRAAAGDPQRPAARRADRRRDPAAPPS